VNKARVLFPGRADFQTAHAGLMAERGGLYYRLCARQFGGIDLARDLPPVPTPPRRPTRGPVVPVPERTSAWSGSVRGRPE
jgi:hypothetical protein